MKTQTLPLPYRVWVVQLLIALLVVCSMIVLGGSAAEKQAWSALVASLALLIPNAVFVWFASDGRRGADLSAKLASRIPGKVFRGNRQEVEAQGQARKILLQQYIKMLLTAILLVLAITLYGPEPLGFFCALVAVQTGYLAAPFVGGK